MADSDSGDNPTWLKARLAALSPEDQSKLEAKLARLARSAQEGEVRVRLQRLQRDLAARLRALRSSPHVRYLDATREKVINIRLKVARSMRVNKMGQQLYEPTEEISALLDGPGQPPPDKRVELYRPYLLLSSGVDGP
jgi:hypothetical protein